MVCSNLKLEISLKKQREERKALQGIKEKDLKTHKITAESKFKAFPLALSLFLRKVAVERLYNGNRGQQILQELLYFSKLLKFSGTMSSFMIVGFFVMMSLF